MCVGYVEKHAGCHHAKDFHIIEPCASGADDLGICNDLRSDIVWIKDINQPALCMNCHHRTEKQILLNYDRKLSDIERDIEWAKQISKGDTEQARLALVTTLISNLEEERGNLIDERYEELDEFRTQQGDWGDGRRYQGIS